MKSRKELIREYKRTPKEMGVYQIRNSVTGRCYVAASKDIKARFNRHRMALKTRKETIKGLQADWVEYGEDAFAFETLDLLEPLDTDGYDPTEDLQVLEALWLEKLEPFEPTGYNRRKVTR